MKNFISVILCVLMLIPCFSLVCMGEEDAPEYGLGDVDMDSDFDLVDIGSTLKYIAKWNVPYEISLDAADVNRDGKINLLDVHMMLNCLVTYPR